MAKGMMRRKKLVFLTMPRRELIDFIAIRWIYLHLHPYYSVQHLKGEIDGME
jgi:hypothetical protein